MKEGKEFYKKISLIRHPENQWVLVDKKRQLDAEYVPEDLELIDVKYNPEGLMLRKEARIAFEKMCHDAYLEGYHLMAISTYRSFYYQWKIYLKNITPCMPIQDYMVERDRVSARPGHSEHQTGLAVDINDLETSFESTGEGIWLARHSFHYGFLLRYPKGKEDITGYAYEPWHFRYLGRELATTVHQSGLTYDEFYTSYLMDKVE